MNRLEMDHVDPQPPTIGEAEALVDAEHTSHSFVYIPDLTMETGWSTHRVPDRIPRPLDRRPVGFRAHPERRS